MTLTITILIILSAMVVLAAVGYVVMGKGGQLARFEADHPPLDLPTDRPVSGADVTRVALPLALWGYHVRAVDEVLHRVSTALAERDTRIAELESRLDDDARAGAPTPSSGNDTPDTGVGETPDTSGGAGDGQMREVL